MTASFHRCTEPKKQKSGFKKQIAQKRCGRFTARIPYHSFIQNCPILLSLSPSAVIQEDQNKQCRCAKSRQGSRKIRRVAGLHRSASRPVASRRHAAARQIPGDGRGLAHLDRTRQEHMHQRLPPFHRFYRCAYRNYRRYSHRRITRETRTVKPKWNLAEKRSGARRT